MGFCTPRRYLAALPALPVLATWFALSGPAAGEAPAHVTPVALETGAAPASAALDVNNHGNAVGHTYDPSTGSTEPLAWHGSAPSPLLAPANGERGRAFQVNDQNQVIGAIEVGGKTHAVIWDPVSDSASIIRPEALFSAAVDLNDQGDVLIWYLAEGPEAQPEHRVEIWRSDEQRDVWRTGEQSGAAGGSMRPVALNSRGEVALTQDGPDGKPAAAYSWFDGELTDIGSLGGGGTQAVAIDEQGRIAGTSLTADGDQRAFIWHDGTMHDLGTLGGDHAEPMAVNDQGEVTGQSLTGDGHQHAFFWDGQEMIDLGTLGGDLSHARALNEQGHVVGHSQTADGQHHAVVWNVHP